MSYAAEPYSQFVDDLLTSLTGGVAREQFVFRAEEGSFRLSPPGPIVPSSLSVFGQSAGAFQRFQPDRDFVLAPDSSLSWQTAADGGPAADAIWPDEGTPFFANYDHTGPLGSAPLLSDRNPGSVVRLLAESFGREFAVVSKQLEAIHRAGFLSTASGRDLDQLVALVGLTRRTRAFATGSVIFSSAAPARADITIQAGTRLSTAEPPAITFETTEDRTLHRGELTVEAPIQALVSGGAGVVPARAVSVIHRPIFGIEAASNPQATEQSGDDESDAALRARARRALETAGGATTGALLGALASLPGVRDNDIRVAEDHLARPGVVTVNVAAPLDGAAALRAILLIDEKRPAGVRVLTNLDAPAPPGGPSAPLNVVDDADAEDTGELFVDGLYLPVQVRIVLLAAAATLSANERSALTTAAAGVARRFVAEAGIGEVLVYNRLVAGIMALEGVLDVALELSPKVLPGEPVGPRHQNLIPPETLRPRLADTDLSVEIAGELVSFDVTVTVALTPLGQSVDPSVSLEVARLQIAAQLQDKITAIVGPITATGLRDKVVPTEYFSLSALHYRVQYLEAGLSINVDDPQIQLAELERAWIRTVRLSAESG